MGKNEKSLYADSEKKVELPYTILIWSLTILGFVTRLYVSRIDPFLNTWDERYHALVAKNMMDFPFRPMLRITPVTSPDPFSWTQGTLWLHKQPLFMWQMALSMKIFGTTVYAVRYPSVLMGTLMIPMVYYITKTISKDRLIALLTASLFCFSNFHLELVGGMKGMDHNDLAFEFYTIASIWAWIKFEEKGKWYWLFLIGIFSGGAILTKWLVGLFVYLIWGLKILMNFTQDFNIKKISRFLISVSVCCLVFLPWQFYIIKHYPVESAFEYAFNRRHITEVLEGHDGNLFFYLLRLPHLFGEFIFLFIFPGLFLWHKTKNKNVHLSAPILIAVLLVFLFFSIVVKTKVLSHIFFIAPFVMMLISYSILFIIKKWIRRPYAIVFLLLVVFILYAKPEKIFFYQSSKNESRNIQLLNAMVYKKVGKTLPKGSVVVNVPDWISFMFFNKGIVAYDNFSQHEIDSLKARKVPIVAFEHVQNRPLPVYISNYPYLKLIHEELH
jgi:4-amino-4-deoxy-L-arabinose transferase